MPITEQVYLSASPSQVSRACRKEAGFVRRGGAYKDVLTLFRGGPKGGDCWLASARKASATRCGWLRTMCFQPPVSITSVAWLKDFSNGKNFLFMGSPPTDLGSISHPMPRSLMQRKGLKFYISTCNLFPTTYTLGLRKKTVSKAKVFPSLKITNWYTTFFYSSGNVK